MYLQICSVTFKGKSLKANEEPNDVSAQRPWQPKTSESLYCKPPKSSETALRVSKVN